MCNLVASIRYKRPAVRSEVKPNWGWYLVPYGMIIVIVRGKAVTFVFTFTPQLNHTLCRELVRPNDGVDSKAGSG